jgi:hypothetical protein
VAKESPSGLVAGAERDREPFDDIAARDADWESKVPQPNPLWDADSIDWSGSPYDEETSKEIFSALQEIADLPRESQLQMHRDLDKFDLALRRLLAVECALAAYRAAHGEYPADLTAVAPRLDPLLLHDPFSNGLFRFRRTGASFLLYSKGPRGGNDEERFGDHLDVHFGNANLCLDVEEGQKY